MNYHDNLETLGIIFLMFIAAKVYVYFEGK